MLHMDWLQVVPEQVGIIALYQAQAFRIRHALQESPAGVLTRGLSSSHSPYTGRCVQVSTVDAFQVLFIYT